jgi:hypothetical protein
MDVGLDRERPLFFNYDAAPHQPQHQCGSLRFSHAAGNNLYTIPAGSPIPAPNQLPEV